jgi:hypothetical protein
VYAKPPFAGPVQVLAYLARYTHRVAIANSRLVDMGGRGSRSLEGLSGSLTREDLAQDHDADGALAPSAAWSSTSCPLTSIASSTEEPRRDLRRGSHDELEP